MSDKLCDKVTQINVLLRSFGRDAVQEIKMMKDGQLIGQIRYGYKPQYVFDAVNTIIFPENWRYEIVSREIFDLQAVVEVKLYIRIASEWFCKGSQTGQMQIVKKNVGDAYKGAITDAIQKCFSLLSIGTDAYRGLLKDVYLGATVPPQQSSEPPPAGQKNDHDLPQIAGIEYQRQNGRVVACGNVYEKRSLLKSAGFRWDGSARNWYRDLTVQ